MRVFLVSDEEVSLASYSIEINYGGLGFRDNYDNYAEELDISRYPYYTKYTNLGGMPLLFTQCIY